MMRMFCLSLILSLAFIGCVNSISKKDINKNDAFLNLIDETNVTMDLLNDLKDTGDMIDVHSISNVLESEKIYFIVLYDYMGLIENLTKKENLTRIDKEDSYSPCGRIYKKIKDVKISATKNEIKYSMSFDWSECQKSMLSSLIQNVDIKKLQATYEMKVRYYCEDGDFSKYDGKSITYFVNKENSEKLKCNHGKVKQFYINILYTNLEFSYTTPQKSKNNKNDLKYEVLAEKKSINAWLNPSNGDGCEGYVSGGILTWQDGCTIYSKTHYIKDSMNIIDLTNNNKKSELSSKTGKTDYKKYVMKNNVKAPTTPPQGYTKAWYSGGEFEVFINGWKGKVVFSSATTAPTYEVTKNGETVTGTITGVNIQD